MICDKCKKEIPDDSEFCAFCGSVVEIVPAVNTEITETDKGYKYLEMKKWKQAKEMFQTSIVNNENVSKAYMGNLLAKLKISDLIKLSQKSKNLYKYDDFKLALKYADENYKNKLDGIADICKNKSKKRNLKLTICSSVAVLACVLTLFIFIPFGRYFWYSSLLSDNNAQKAVASFANSKLFEYDALNKNLFYKKGVEFVENKHYKNGELCFEKIDKYKDSNNYYNYCKAQNLLAGNDLESYDYFKKCGEFLDSEQILKTNKYFKMVDKLQGEWYHPPGKSIAQQKREARESGKYYEVDGAFYPKSAYKSYSELIEALNGKYGGITTMAYYIDNAETIQIKGGNKLNISNGIIEYKDEPVVFVSDNIVKIYGREFKKQ